MLKRIHLQLQAIGAQGALKLSVAPGDEFGWKWISQESSKQFFAHHLYRMIEKYVGSPLRSAPEMCAEIAAELNDAMKAFREGALDQVEFVVEWIPNQFDLSPAAFGERDPSAAKLLEVAEHLLNNHHLHAMEEPLREAIAGFKRSRGLT